MGLISDINIVKGEWEEGTDGVMEIQRPVYLNVRLLIFITCRSHPRLSKEKV